MASLNRCSFIGNLGKDPDMRYLPSGEAVANFSIACTEKWKDKATGETKEATEWVRLCAFSRTAEIAGQYLQKGSPVYVEGRMRTSKYEKDGQERYATEIVVDRMVLLGGKSGDAGETRAQQQAQSYPRPTPKPAGQDESPRSQFDDLEDDDIPF